MDCGRGPETLLSPGSESARYEQKQIYTWLGDVLVSVNPYTNVGAFEEEVVARYSGKEMPKAHVGADIAWVVQAPHLYAVVSQALAAEGKRRGSRANLRRFGSGMRCSSQVKAALARLRHLS